MSARRGFLSLLLGTAAASLIELPEFLVFDEKALRATDVGVDRVRLDTLTRAVLTEFERIANPRLLDITDGKMGSDYVRHLQMSISVPREEEMEIQERFVRPVAHAFHETTRHDGLRRFHHPQGRTRGDGEWAFVKTERAGLRGALYYDLDLDFNVIRFDMIAA